MGVFVKKLYIALIGFEIAYYQPHRRQKTENIFSSFRDIFIVLVMCILSFAHPGNKTAFAFLSLLKMEL